MKENRKPTLKEAGDFLKSKYPELRNNENLQTQVEQAIENDNFFINSRSILANGGDALHAYRRVINDIDAMRRCDKNHLYSFHETGSLPLNPSGINKEEFYTIAEALYNTSEIQNTNSSISKLYTKPIYDEVGRVSERRKERNAAKITADFQDNNFDLVHYINSDSPSNKGNAR